jgi:hypothetical protein
VQKQVNYADEHTMQRRSYFMTLLRQRFENNFWLLFEQISCDSLKLAYICKQHDVTADQLYKVLYKVI